MTQSNHAPATAPHRSIIAMSFSFPTLLLAVSAFLIFSLARAIYLLFFHPLSAIPGPWYADITSLWITSHILRLKQCKTIQELFQTYGPIVRIAPNRVVFCDLGAMKSVYSTWKFDKSVYYKSLVMQNDNDHAMTTLPHAQHLLCRKAYASFYAPSNLAKLQPEISRITAQMIDALHNLPAHTSVETLSLFRHLALDIIVWSSYGFHHGAIGKWAENAEDSLTLAIYDFPKRGVLRSLVPKWAWFFVCRFPNARLRLLCDSARIMAEFVEGRVNEMRAPMKEKEPARDGDDSDKSYMLSRLLAYKFPSGEPMREEHVISECMGHLVAGTDTMSLSLSFFLWELSRRPDITRKLQQEIDTAMPDPKVIPSIQELNGLEYFNAFIKEGLRLYGAVPSLLERVVLETGSPKYGVGVEKCNLLGYDLPPGTIVSTQAWSMHRDPAVFPSPETFLPERYLPSPSLSKEEGDSDLADTERLTRMANHLIPFGTGSRLCGGMNLAHLGLRMILAAVLRNFHVEAAPGTDERSMDARDSFVMFPASGECKLIFKSRGCALS
ncbi:cytochrome P450 [Roridomyces roridus]|uniref:Cytochrome P450 n=1 Tax=Roridomyces roridus TaxID=1738132 RepID=A0AAD7FMK1_9AGAR|nr:cytochrome P450 [Roridomyces roridus]